MRSSPLRTDRLLYQDWLSRSIAKRLEILGGAAPISTKDLASETLIVACCELTLSTLRRVSEITLNQYATFIYRPSEALRFRVFVCAAFSGGFTLSTSAITSLNGSGMCGIGLELVSPWHLVLCFVRLLLQSRFHNFFPGPGSGYHDFNVLKV